MNKFTRTFFQLILWSFIWIIQWLNKEDSSRFFANNWATFVFQGLLIVSLTYIFAPQFLFKKKYFQFGLLSIVLILVCSIVSAEVVEVNKHIQMPPMHHDGFPPPPRAEKGEMPGPLLINFLLIAVSYVLAIFLETFAFAQKKEADLILSKSETVETELKFLKSQINPHFLFNSLNNIYALSAIDSVRTQESILHLSDMLRYVLYDCEKKLVVIEKEVAYIQDFIDLFKLKSSKSYPIETVFSIENPQLEIAPMLLIPFVENAFKHSNIQDVATAFIKISIHATNETVIFKVQNSFRKMVKSKDAVGGIGIQNVKKRLALLYPDAHSLSINENEGSFEVELKIEVNA